MQIRTWLGGSLSTLAMIVSSSGKVWIGGFLLALGVAVLYKRHDKESVP